MRDHEGGGRRVTIDVLFGFGITFCVIRLVVQSWILLSRSMND